MDAHEFLDKVAGRTRSKDYDMGDTAIKGTRKPEGDIRREGKIKERPPVRRPADPFKKLKDYYSIPNSTGVTSPLSEDVNLGDTKLKGGALFGSKTPSGIDQVQTFVKKVEAAKKQR